MSRRVVAAALAGIVAVAAVWYLALWSPQSASLAEAQKKTAAAVVQEHTLARQVASLQRQQGELPGLKAKLARLNAEIPTTPDIAKVIDGMNAAAVAAGVTIKTLSPSAAPATAAAATPAGATTPSGAAGATRATSAAGPANSASATTRSGTAGSAAGATSSGSSSAAAATAPTATAITVALTVSGTYFQLIDFANRLSALPRLTVVDTFSLSAPDKTGAIAMSISTRVFTAPAS